MKITLEQLESLYWKYNKFEFIHPDPLEFLYKYPEKKDIEIVALIASSLAYGRVAQILKSVTLILSKMIPSPHTYLLKNNKIRFEKDFSGFKHRFTSGEEIICLMLSIKNILYKYSSVENCFLSYYNDSDENILPASKLFVKEISRTFENSATYLFPSPEKGSACKRLMLLLRWMIRKDDVDLGHWTGIPSSKLIIPLDTHMHQISKLLDFTTRKQANLKTAVEISEAFKKLYPVDPVRYDFALTRFGIRKDMNYDEIGKAF